MERTKELDIPALHFWVTGKNGNHLIAREPQGDEVVQLTDYAMNKLASDTYVNREQHYIATTEQDVSTIRFLISFCKSMYVKGEGNEKAGDLLSHTAQKVVNSLVSYIETRVKFGIVNI